MCGSRGGEGVQRGGDPLVGQLKRADMRSSVAWPMNVLAICPSGIEEGNCELSGVGTVFGQRSP